MGGSGLQLREEWIFMNAFFPSLRIPRARFIPQFQKCFIYCPYPISSLGQIEVIFYIFWFVLLCLYCFPHLKRGKKKKSPKSGRSTIPMALLSFIVRAPRYEHAQLSFQQDPHKKDLLHLPSGSPRASFGVTSLSCCLWGGPHLAPSWPGAAYNSALPGQVGYPCFNNQPVQPDGTKMCPFPHPPWPCTPPGTGLHRWHHRSDDPVSMMMAPKALFLSSIDELGVESSGFTADGSESTSSAPEGNRRERGLSCAPLSALPRRWPAGPSSQQRTCCPWLLQPLFPSSLGVLWREC